MTRAEPESEWCRRLSEAIMEGRFVEDPGLWRPHYETCSRCRGAVEGYRLLRRLIDLSRPAGGPAKPPGPAAEPPQLLASAFARYHRHRSSRRVAITLVALLAVALGLWASLGRGGAGDVTLRTDPERALNYAAHLYDQLSPQGKPSQVGRLAADPELERQYVEALSHPSAVVRRVAYLMLALGGRPVPARETRRLLEEARPEMERPVELAGAGDSGRHVAAALEQGRANLIRTVLGGLAGTSTGQSATVPASVLVSYLSDGDAGVREAALVALDRDETFEPGPEVEQALRLDPQLAVRRWAGMLILRRKGSAGQDLLVRHFATHDDTQVEAALADRLGRSAAALDLARRRLSDPATGAVLALRHAHALVKAGERIDAQSVLDRDLSADDEAAFRLALLAAEAGWDQHRDVLQARWRESRGVHRLSAGATLARWDVAVGTLARLDLALEILADGRNPAARPVLRELEAHADPAIRARAVEIAAQWGSRR